MRRARAARARAARARAGFHRRALPLRALVLHAAISFPPRRRPLHVCMSAAVDASTAKMEAASIAKKGPPPAPELLVLLLSYGMSGTELAATLESLKTASKQIGSHRRRQLYWEA